MGDRNLDIDRNGYLNVYTDGSCENNGQAGAKAGYGVYFGPSSSM